MTVSAQMSALGDNVCPVEDVECQTKTGPSRAFPPRSKSNVQNFTTSQRFHTSTDEDLLHDVNNADHQGVRDGYSHTPTSFQNEPFATASPLISHNTSANLQRNVACEDVGATLINEMATGPAALQGGLQNRANRFPPRNPIAKKKKAAPPKGRAVQAPRRGKGFTKNETESLLELLEEHLPLAKEEWEEVARLHELRYPQQKRNTDSIRRKLSSLCRTIPPTGDPSIPSDVLKSKEIRRVMTERADIGDGEDSEEEYTVDMNQETAPFSSATPATSGSAASSLPPNSDQVEREQAAANTLPSSTPSGNPSPRPLVRKRTAMPSTDNHSIMGALKASILQEQMRREEDFRQQILDKEEERKRLEEARHNREQERLEDRERRAEERQRSDKMTQMMFVAMLGPRASIMFADKNNSSEGR